MNFVLDTCVLSETIKPEPNAGLVDWLKKQKQDTLFICTISLGELRKGIDRMPAGSKKHNLLLWLTDLASHYNRQFLDFDAESAFIWGSLSAAMEIQGKKMPVIDSMIAACTLRHGLCLVTRNERDYQHSGVLLVNPWQTGTPQSCY